MEKSIIQEKITSILIGWSDKSKLAIQEILTSDEKIEIIDTLEKANKNDQLNAAFFLEQK